MTLRQFENISPPTGEGRNARRKADNGVGFGVAVLGGFCAVGVLALLALLYH